jgi:hypothetical protein
LVPGLSLAGAPFTSGAFAKATLKAAAASVPEPWHFALSWLLPVGAVGTTLLITRFLVLAWPRYENQGREMPAAMWWPWVALLTGVVAIVPIWMWSEGMELNKLALSPEKLWKSAWPVGLGCLMALIAGTLARPYLRFAVGSIPPGDLIVPIGRLVGLLHRRVKSLAAAVSMMAARGRDNVAVRLARVQARTMHAAAPVEQTLSRPGVAGPLLLLLGAALLAALMF